MTPATATTHRAPVRYFHGGIPDLKPGNLVLPPDITGTSRTLAEYSEQLADSDHVRRDRVYITTGRDVAKVYAAFYPDGALYEVEPDGETVPDPDCSVPGVSFECPAARVLRVIDPVVLLRARPVNAWVRQLNRSTDAAGQLDKART
ncbi:hypothetical protein ACH4UM_18735 [Streptomyces sp. NPDC020801]|uniref:hypothetical protein n=1 Tax=Streptomyces sp. NPDC020801 TaxID=3365093 RepID=UPI0037BBB5E9